VLIQNVPDGWGNFVFEQSFMSVRTGKGHASNLNAVKAEYGSWMLKGWNNWTGPPRL